MWFRNTDSEWHWIYTKVKLISVNIDAELNEKLAMQLKSTKTIISYVPGDSKLSMC